MSESSPRERAKRRTERAEQLSFTLPEAAEYTQDPAPEYDLSGYTPNEPSERFQPAGGYAPDPAPEYDLSGYTPNEPSERFQPAGGYAPDPAPEYDLSGYTPNEPSERFQPAGGYAPDPAPEYDLSGFTPNEPSERFQPAGGYAPDPAPEYDLSGYTPNEPSEHFTPVQQTAPAPEELLPEEPAREPEAIMEAAAPETPREEPLLPEGKVSRGALYAVLKTEAGLNTDMLEPVPTDARTPDAFSSADAVPDWLRDAPAAQPSDVPDWMQEVPEMQPLAHADGAMDALVASIPAEQPAAAPTAVPETAPVQEAVQPEATPAGIPADNPAPEAEEYSIPNNKRYAARAAVYAGLKTEAGMNTDMLEPVHPTAIPPEWFGGDGAPQVQTAEPPQAVQPAPAKPSSVKAKAEAARQAVMARQTAEQLQAAPQAQTAEPPQAVQPAPARPSSVKAKAEAARQAVMAEMARQAEPAQTAAQIQTAPQAQTAEPPQAVQPAPAKPSSVKAKAEAARQAVMAEMARQAEPAQTAEPPQAVQPAPAKPSSVKAKAEAARQAVMARQTAPQVPDDDTRTYPPLHGDEPTKIAPAIKHSKPDDLSPMPPVTPLNTEMPVDASPRMMSEPNQINEPAAPQEPSPERSQLAANLSAYYRRAASISAQEKEDTLNEPMNRPTQTTISDEDGSSTMNVYRPREASWAQDERQTMLVGEEAEGYQVSTEDRRRPSARRRRKRLIRRMLLLAVAAVLIGFALLYLSHRPEETPLAATATATPAITATPQPVRGYDAATAMAVSDKADKAIEQISSGVEMTPAAVTAENVLNRSLREDGLYDFYLFSADGRLLGYYDGLKQDGMSPMQGGGFHVDMPPYLVSAEGTALISPEGLESTLGSDYTLRPFMNGWSRILTGDGESNFIDREGKQLSRLWFCRSFSMTGSESVAYVDTGVLQSPTRYTLYLLDAHGAGTTLKWRDAADDRQVVTAQLGMVYLQNGELYSIRQLLENPAAEPLCNARQVRFYLDCNAMVVQEANGKFALWVGGQKLYDAVYDSILPVESDVRWKGDILPAENGQAMVLSISGASYPQPLSYYFALTREGGEEHVALSAVTNCPILLD